MIKNLCRVYKTVLKNWYITKTSKYRFKEKIIIFKILNTLFFKSLFYKNRTEIVQDIFQFKVSANSYNTLSFLFKEIFVDNDYFFETDSAKPIIIDCGANIGISVLFFKFIYPDCSIVAFEPNPQAFKLLKKNVEQNNLKDIELHNLALTDKEGETEFFIGDNENILLASTIAERGRGEYLRLNQINFRII